MSNPETITVRNPWLKDYIVQVELSGVVGDDLKQLREMSEAVYKAASAARGAGVPIWAIQKVLQYQVADVQVSPAEDLRQRPWKGKK